jgi:outer membrane protein TolC
MVSTHSRVAWLAIALWLPACVGSGGAHYRALDEELATLEEDAAQRPERLFAGSPELERRALVAEVLRRNPSLAAARFGWRAALARYPQVTAFDDPMVGYSLAPRTFGSGTVPQEAHRFDVSQAIPFPGKLALRGAAALAEAEASGQDFAAVRLRLATMASILFDEYWLLARSAAINDEHLELVRELREIATSRYESGLAAQQDPLRAEIEETELLHRKLELATTQRITAQQIAALLHVRDGAELPPPPAAFAPVSTPADLDLETALEERPELRAAGARIEAREAAEGSALREYFPDFRLMGVYDRGWDVTDMRPMVGLELNVPLQRGRRRGAVEQARAELEQARRERHRIEDEVRTEVVTARERLAEARHLLDLKRDRALPAARDRVAAVRAGFEAGRSDFDDWIEAERALRDAELATESALVDTSRRAAELAAALGQMPMIDTPSDHSEAHGVSDE